ARAKLQLSRRRVQPDGLTRGEIPAASVERNRASFFTVMQAHAPLDGARSLGHGFDQNAGLRVKLSGSHGPHSGYETVPRAMPSSSWALLVEFWRRVISRSAGPKGGWPDSTMRRRRRWMSGASASE